MLLVSIHGLVLIIGHCRMFPFWQEFSFFTTLGTRPRPRSLIFWQPLVGGRQVWFSGMTVFGDINFLRHRVDVHNIIDSLFQSHTTLTILIRDQNFASEPVQVHSEVNQTFFWLQFIFTRILD
jgi:hypothetical protein